MVEERGRAWAGGAGSRALGRKCVRVRRQTG